MHGTWTITVKSKSAAFAQQFVVSGGGTNNGPHPGTVGSPPVTVLAGAGFPWTIQIQNNPGSGVFRDSAMQLTSPTVLGTGVSFDILSEDAGDGDFNDLVLTCFQPFHKFIKENKDIKETHKEFIKDFKEFKEYKEFIYEVHQKREIEIPKLKDAEVGDPFQNIGDPAWLASVEQRLEGLEKTIGQNPAFIKSTERPAVGSKVAKAARKGNKN